MKRLIKIIKWIWSGCPFIYYEHFWCGACGRHWHIPFLVPKFDSFDEWVDTWGVCPKDRGCNENSVSGPELYKEEKENNGGSG